MSEETRIEFLKNYAIDKLTAFLMEDRHVSLEHALDTVYASRIYDLLQDRAADLTADSPAYIYELLKDELTDQ